MAKQQTPKQAPKVYTREEVDTANARAIDYMRDEQDARLAEAEKEYGAALARMIKEAAAAQTYWEQGISTGRGDGSMTPKYLDSFELNVGNFACDIVRACGKVKGVRDMMRARTDADMWIAGMEKCIGEQVVGAEKVFEGVTYTFDGTAWVKGTFGGAK